MIVGFTSMKFEERSHPLPSRRAPRHSARISTGARPSKTRPLVNNRIATRREVLIRSFLILVSASLVAITSSLIVIRPSLFPIVAVWSRSRAVRSSIVLLNRRRNLIRHSPDR